MPRFARGSSPAVFPITAGIDLVDGASDSLVVERIEAVAPYPPPRIRSASERVSAEDSTPSDPRRSLRQRLKTASATLGWPSRSWRPGGR